MTSVLPLISMVRSQDAASRMLRADLDRWHQHGKMLTSSLKIASLGEVPMITGAQQKLLIWLKNTAAALVAYRATSLEHEDIILQKLTDVILQLAKLTWEAAVESAMLEQPLTPTAPCDGFGARTKSCALSVVSVAVLGGDAMGRDASFRLDHHRGSRCHGAT